MNRFRKYIEDFINGDKVAMVGEEKSVELINIADSIAYSLEKNEHLSQAEMKINTINGSRIYDNEIKKGNKSKWIKKQSWNEVLYDPVFCLLNNELRLIFFRENNKNLLGGLAIPYSEREKIRERIENITHKIEKRTMKEDEYNSLINSSLQNIALKLYLGDYSENG